MVTPAYLSSWDFALELLTFPTPTTSKELPPICEGDAAAAGFDTEIRYGEKNRSFANLRTYFINDENPLLNRTSLPRGSIDSERYRLSLQDQTFFTEDITGLINITKLSDKFVLQDFFQSEFRVEPNPDNIVALNKVSPNYTLTAFTRFQANTFFEPPNVCRSGAHYRQPVFCSPIFYEANHFANLDVVSEVPHQILGATIDSFHQYLPQITSRLRRAACGPAHDLLQSVPQRGRRGFRAERQSAHPRVYFATGGAAESAGPGR